MKIAVFIALALLLYLFLILWMITQIRYHLTSRHLRITVLGICLRRIPLANIESVTKRRPGGLAENWCNTLQPSHRMLILRLKRGLRRSIIITPRNRYVMKTELDKAMANLEPGAALAQPSSDTDVAEERAEAGHRRT